MPATSPFQWDDLRVFLATMRAASLRGAAAELGVSRQTAARRLSELERRLGLQLFERRADGLHATAEAAGLLAAAEQAEEAMVAVARVAQSMDPEIRGPVRVTMPPLMAADLLMPDLRAFTERWPEVDVHISGSIRVESLADRAADVAIRFMPHGRSPAIDLVGRKVAVAYSAIYGEADCWIGQPGLPPGWYESSPFPNLPVRGGMDDGEVLRSACDAGVGLTFLPCFIAEPLLKRRSDPEPAFDIWVVVHQDLRRTPRLRLFRDAMVEAILDKRDRLEGRQPLGP